MFTTKAVFSSFSVTDMTRAIEFYTKTLGLTVDSDTMGLRLHTPSGATIFAYPKNNHQPATYTVLNFVVDSIDTAVSDLRGRGVVFERYEGMDQDEQGIMRGKRHNRGPDIAWFKDPDGNILSVIED